MKLLSHLRAVAQQSAVRSASRATREPKFTKNRLNIVSLENDSPVTKLSLYVRAGSRYETGFNLGVSHCLRSAANLTTKQRTAVNMTRTIQQIGGSLTATGTKEHIIYTVEADRNHADVALECLLEAVFQPSFNHWEIDRLKSKMSLDLALHKLNQEERVIELIHQAAFRDTVGRPLYAPEFMLGNFETSQLSNFTEAHYTPDRMAIVGLGCPHDWLESKTVSFIKNPSGVTRHFPAGNKPAEVNQTEKAVDISPNTEAAKYYGGQLREESNSNLAMLALAGEGVSLANKEAAAAFVLQRVFGAGPRVKWSASQTHGRLAKAVAGALPSGSMFAISGLNYNYSDSGLFGFFLTVDPALAGKAARAAILETGKIANGSLTEAELAVAKQQAKADMLFSLEEDCAYSAALAQSVLVSGEVMPSVDQAMAEIDAVGMKEVLQVAKRAAGSRTSMAAVGDLADTPYLEQVIA